MSGAFSQDTSSPTLKTEDGIFHAPFQAVRVVGADHPCPLCTVKPRPVKQSPSPGKGFRARMDFHNLPSRSSSACHLSLKHAHSTAMARRPSGQGVAKGRDSPGETKSPTRPRLLHGMHCIGTSQYEFYEANGVLHVGRSRSPVSWCHLTLCPLEVRPLRGRINNNSGYNAKVFHFQLVSSGHRAIVHARCIPWQFAGGLSKNARSAASSRTGPFAHAI